MGFENCSQTLTLCFVFVFNSQGNGHYFPLKSLNESHNPLLANDEMWEESDEGSDEGSIGEHFFCLVSRILPQNV